MKRIIFLTPKAVPHGFAAAGFEQQTVADTEAAAALLAARNAADVGVIIVDERLLPAIDEALLTRLRQNWAGILLVLPAPAAGAAAEEDYLQRMIRRALGYHIRIQE